MPLTQLQSGLLCAQCNTQVFEAHYPTVTCYISSEVFPLYSLFHPDALGHHKDFRGGAYLDA